MNCIYLHLQRGLLEVLYDIFRLPLPVVTEEFIEALLSVGKYQGASASIHML